MKPSDRRAAAGPASPGRRRGGQTIVFLLLALTILAFVFLWNVDLHRIVWAKSLSQNAGDSAALAAARWQAETLNLVGELNLMHALAMSLNNADTPAAVDAITNMQARVCFTGPLIGLMAAQVAAKNNRLYEQQDFTDAILSNAAKVRSYDDTVDGVMDYPPPFPDAWLDYATMLETAGNHGIAAYPENARFYNDITGDHILLIPAFYEAVAGRSWCWFYLNYRYSDNPLSTILDVYTDYTWWPPLPDPDPPPFSFYNSEIFGVGLTPVSTALDYADMATLQLGAAQQEIDMSGLVPTNVVGLVETWYWFAPGLWRDWDEIHVDGPEPFPVVGPVKPEYDYLGADAAIRVYAGADRLTPAADGSQQRDDILWTAAAKPFGYLETDDSTRLRPDTYSMVLPAFRDVRLIPVDASTAGGGGSANPDWRVHVLEHLPVYLSTGAVQAGCWYCDQLTTWDTGIEPGGLQFRTTGSAWLSVNYYLCTLPSGGGGGGGPGGGTRRGH
jgi:hypothetical protein